MRSCGICFHILLLSSSRSFPFSRIQVFVQVSDLNKVNLPHYWLSAYMTTYKKLGSRHPESRCMSCAWVSNWGVNRKVCRNQLWSLTDHRSSLDERTGCCHDVVRTDEAKNTDVGKASNKKRYNSNELFLIKNGSISYHITHSVIEANQELAVSRILRAETCLLINKAA